MNYANYDCIEGFPSIGVAYSCLADCAELTYWGPAADLIAAGVVTSNVIAPGRQAGGRKDADGNWLGIDRYWRSSKEGQPVRCLRLRFLKRSENVAKMPGAIKAVHWTASPPARDDLCESDAYLQQQVEDLL